VQLPWQVTNFSSEVQKDILCTLHEKRPEAFEIARISEPQDGYEFHVKIRKPSIYLSSKAQWIYALHLKIKHVFYQGKSLAYYEMLGVLKLELEVTGEDLRDYGLSYDIE